MPGPSWTMFHNTGMPWILIIRCLIASSLATPHLPFLSLSLSLSLPSSLQDENTFILSHFTGDRYYTISEDWIKINSTHLPPPDHILQSLLSSPNDLLCLLAKVLTSCHNKKQLLILNYFICCSELIWVMSWQPVWFSLALWTKLDRSLTSGYSGITGSHHNLSATVCSLSLSSAHQARLKQGQKN